MLHIDPIADFFGDVLPFFGELHHRLAARLVVVFYGDCLADVFFGDAEGFFHAEFHGEAVGVPTGFPIYEEAFGGLVPEHGVLDGACEYVVYARTTVCRRRSFIENESRVALPCFEALPESIFVLPQFQHLLVDVGQVKLFVFSEFL